MATLTTTTTMTSAPNIDGMLLLEAPFARVPHDELKRQLRAQQRLVERDLSACSTILSTLTQSAKMEGVEDEVNMHQSDAVVETSFAQVDSSFMTDGSRADDSVMTVEEDVEGEGEGTKMKSSDLEKSLDVMLGRLKGLKRKVSLRMQRMKLLFCSNLVIFFFFFPTAHFCS